jgi:hypothetical protein
MICRALDSLSLLIVISQETAYVILIMRISWLAERPISFWRRTLPHAWHPPIKTAYKTTFYEVSLRQAYRLTL